MEVRRLVTALHILQEDVTQLAMVQKLATLQSAAASTAAAPNDIPSSEGFERATLVLREDLASARSNVAPVSIRQAIKEAGVESLIGSSILARLNEIFDHSPFLMSRAVQSLTQLFQSVKADAAKLEAALAALNNLGFSPEEIPLEEYEIGVLIPTSVIQDDLKRINGEMKEWIYVIDRIDELVHGQVSSTIPVRSMSSGSFDMFVSLDPQGAFALLLVVSGVYKMFQYVRDAAKRREDMEKANYPSNYIEAIKPYEKDLIEAGKLEILKDLLARKSPSIDANRAKEMETPLRHAIDFVLESMNSGVDVEVSTPPTAQAEREVVDEEIKQLQAKIEALRLEMTKIIGSLPDRSKPILQLPKASPQQPPDDGAPPRPSKPPPKGSKEA